jgi:hypothetical protein
LFTGTVSSPAACRSLWETERQQSGSRNAPWVRTNDHRGHGRNARSCRNEESRPANRHFDRLRGYDEKGLDKAGVAVLLVGDPLAQVILGLDTTVPAALNAVVHYMNGGPQFESLG